MKSLEVRSGGKGQRRKTTAWFHLGKESFLMPHTFNVGNVKDKKFYLVKM